MKSVFSHKYQTFRRCMIVARKEAQLTQESIAKSLKKPQSFVAKYEKGERRLDVIEFLLVAHVIGVDPCDIIRKVAEGMCESSSEGEI
ncbi:MAG: XRE family transcriptional regulator [Oscillatoriales cyanobacterium]|nr:MAG: XRE family transcriptional regulator [Oscillatoriales cyanobacterium]TAH23962.1 MAG: XRE family transcriptional regulator [Oscillatoriales cyanobacterium]